MKQNKVKIPFILYKNRIKKRTTSKAVLDRGN
jgi:hypothetical protein